MSNMEELIRQTVEKTTGVNRIAKSVQTLAGNGAALDRDVFVLASMLLKSQQKIIDLQDEQIGRAHVCTPVTNAHLVCRLLLEKKKRNYYDAAFMTIKIIHNIN